MPAATPTHTGPATTGPASIGGRSPWAWAFYLGVSWTWCIGMFLPVLLVRDYGPASFLIFAIPNVIGAAAMSWVLRTQQASLNMVASHRWMCRLFSAVTIAFQAFFACWLLRWTGLPEAQILVAGVLLATLSNRFGSTVSSRRELPVAAWIASVAVLAVAAVKWGLNSPLPPPPHRFESESWALAPVCLLGFGLCPYLDLTFHRARQELQGRGAKLGFGIGFGAVFLLMILGTLVYSGKFAALADPRATLETDWIIRLVALGHILPQLLVTIVLHARDAGELGSVGAIEKPRAGMPVAALGLLVLAAGAFIPLRASGPGGLMLGEATYRSFMAFYGLLFPAYVWLCVVPTPDRHSGPRVDKLLVLAVVLILATPCYWLGFIERQTIWLAPGVAIVLLARLIVRRPLTRPAPAVTRTTSNPAT